MDKARKERQFMSEDRWQYTTVKKPVDHRMAADDHPDHKFWYIRRTDRLTPHAARSQYHARCSCKWQARTVDGTTKWSSNVRQAKGNHEEHISEVLKQGSLL